MVLCFAYGSNMNEMLIAKKLDGLKYRIMDKGKGVLNSHALESNKLYFERQVIDNITTVQDEKSSVEGVVFELDDKNVKKLDFSMGLVSGHCYRKPVQVETEKGMAECYIYVAFRPEKD